MEQDQQVSVAGLSALLDFGFRQFITLGIIKVLYVLGAGVIGLVVVVGLIGALTQGGLAALAVLVIAPVVGLLSLILLRVWLELVVVIFRLWENTSKLVQQGNDATAALTGAGA